MAVPDPKLGYKSITAAAVALQKQGLDIAAIASIIGKTDREVEGLLHNAENHRRRRNRLIRIECLLGKEAARRGITLPELKLRILEAVAADRLTDAILDDAANQEVTEKKELPSCQLAR